MRALVFVAVFAACGKKDETKPTESVKAPPTETKPPEAAKAPPPETAKGPPTKAAFRDAMAAFAVEETLEPAVKIVEGRLGKAKLNGTVRAWYFQDAESCLELTLEDKAGALVAGGGEWYAASEADDYKACIERAK